MFNVIFKVVFHVKKKKMCLIDKYTDKYNIINNKCIRYILSKFIDLSVLEKG